MKGTSIMRLGALLAALGSWLGSCSTTKPPTQLVVVVDAEQPLAGDLDRLEVQLVGRDGEGPPLAQHTFLLTQGQATETRLALPLSFGVEPRDERARFRIQVTGFGGNEKLAEQTVITGFRLGHQSVLRLVLYEACREVFCQPDQTCFDRNQCEPVPEVVDDLPDLPEGEDTEFDVAPVDTWVVGMDGGEAPTDASSGGMDDGDASTGSLDGGPDGGSAETDASDPQPSPSCDVCGGCQDDWGCPAEAACRQLCELGDTCEHGPQCESGTCAGTCRPACSGECELGTACVESSDCQTQICASETCSLDCAGACGVGSRCTGDADCGDGECGNDELCHPVCAGSCAEGEACVSAADCASGTCTDDICRPSCSGSCGVGETCVVTGDCAAASSCGSDALCHPACAGSCTLGGDCAADSDCASDKCVDTTCRPDCSGSCTSGSPCVGDADCAGSASCDPTDGVCVVECPGATIASVADLNDRRYCRRFTGDLTINGANDIEQMGVDDLPYLTHIGGNLRFEGGVQTVELPVLQTIGGVLNLGGALSGLERAEFPVLQSINAGGTSSDSAITNASGIQRVELPVLTEVVGHVDFGFVPQFERLNLANLSRVRGNFTVSHSSTFNSINVQSLTQIDGDLQLVELPQLVYSAVSHLNDPSHVGGSITIQAVGCCAWLGEDSHGCADYSCQ